MLSVAPGARIFMAVGPVDMRRSFDGLCATITEALGGGPTAYLVATIGGEAPIGYRVRFDPEVFGFISELAAKFVRDHLQTGKPPEGWEQDRSAMEYVAKRWAKSDGVVRLATEEDQAALLDYREAEALLEAAEQRASAAKARLAARVGDSKSIKGVASWVDVRPGEPKEVVDWRMVAQEAAVAAGWLPEQAQAIAAKWTTQEPGKKGFRYIKPYAPRKTNRTLSAPATAGALEQ